MADITLIGEANHGHETQAEDIQRMASSMAPDAIFTEVDAKEREGVEALDPDLRTSTYGGMNQLVSVGEYCEMIGVPKSQVLGNYPDIVSQTPLYELEVGNLETLYEHRPHPEVNEEIREWAKDTIKSIYKSKVSIGSSTRHRRQAHLCDVHDIGAHHVDTGRTELLRRAAEEEEHLPDSVQEGRDVISNALSASSEESAKEHLGQGLIKYISDNRDVRDDIMVDNIDESIEREGYENGVAVVGDEHVEGLAEKLSDRGHDVTCLRYEMKDDTIDNEEGSWTIQTLEDLE